ncbi:hypothetical protein IE339_04740 [Priestia koreensis]|nr:hypothetical protein IE339_04740 [Priestia koreensis]
MLYNKENPFIRKGASNDSVSLTSTEHTEQAPFQRGAYFKEKSKEWSKIEGKNSEFKHRHGYDVATSTGIVGMEMQGARAIFTINLKRMKKSWVDSGKRNRPSFSVLRSTDYLKNPKFFSGLQEQDSFR